MKLVTLAAPTTIGTRIVMPVEGQQTVTDEQAADLKAEGLLVGEPIPIGETEASPPAPRGKPRA